MKFKNDPKSSCRKMCGLFQNLVMWVEDSFLTPCFLFERFSFRNAWNTVGNMNNGSNEHLIWEKSQPSVSMLGFEDHNSWVVACWLLTSHETAQTDSCKYWLSLPLFDKIYQDHSLASTALSIVFCCSPLRSFEQHSVRKKLYILFYL